MPLPSGLYTETMKAATGVTVTAAVLVSLVAGVGGQSGLDLACLGGVGVGDWRTAR